MQSAPILAGIRFPEHRLFDAPLNRDHEKQEKERDYMEHINTRSTQTGNVPSNVAGLPIVNVWYGGRSIGLYRVNRIDERALVLNHGGISFPVGTQLDIVDFQRLVPNADSPRLSTQVVDNNRSGIRLAW
jgi:hypothetical protein